MQPPPNYHFTLINNINRPKGTLPSRRSFTIILYSIFRRKCTFIAEHTKAYSASFVRRIINRCIHKRQSPSQKIFLKLSTHVYTCNSKVLHISLYFYCIFSKFSFQSKFQSNQIFTLKNQKTNQYILSNPYTAKNPSRQTTRRDSQRFNLIQSFYSLYNPNSLRS